MRWHNCDPVVSKLDAKGEGDLSREDETTEEQRAHSESKETILRIGVINGNEREDWIQPK